MATRARGRRRGAAAPRRSGCGPRRGRSTGRSRCPEAPSNAASRTNLGSRRSCRRSARLPCVRRAPCDEDARRRWRGCSRPRDGTKPEPIRNATPLRCHDRVAVEPCRGAGGGADHRRRRVATRSRLPSSARYSASSAARCSVARLVRRWRARRRRRKSSTPRRPGMCTVAMAARARSAAATPPGRPAAGRIQRTPRRRSAPAARPRARWPAGRRDGAQHAVAGRVAGLPVVDALEAVEVEDREAQRAARAAGTGDLAREALAERAAVSGQLVGAGELEGVGARLGVDARPAAPPPRALQGGRSSRGAARAGAAPARTGGPTAPLADRRGGRRGDAAATSARAASSSSACSSSRRASGPRGVEREPRLALRASGAGQRSTPA